MANTQNAMEAEMAAQFLVPPPHVMALRHEEAAHRAKRRKQRQWRQRQAQARAITFRRLELGR